MPPAPSNMMVIYNGTITNQYASGMSSHTTTVESFNDNTITTIEGNKGHKVTASSLNLENSDEVGHIIFMARAGTEFFDTVEVATEDQNNDITLEDILKPQEIMTRSLQLIADQMEYIHSVDEGATVFEMSGSNNTGGTN